MAANLGTGSCACARMPGSHGVPSEHRLRRTSDCGGCAVVVVSFSALSFTAAPSDSNDIAVLLCNCVSVVMPIKVERAIAEKYGEEAVHHPKREWTDDKEKQYLEDLKKLHKNYIEQESSKEEINFKY